MEEGAEGICKACLEKEAGAQTCGRGVPAAFPLPSCLRRRSFRDAEIRQGLSSSGWAATQAQGGT